MFWRSENENGKNPKRKHKEHQKNNIQRKEIKNVQIAKHIREIKSCKKILNARATREVHLTVTAPCISCYQCFTRLASTMRCSFWFMSVTYSVHAHRWFCHRRRAGSGSVYVAPPSLSTLRLRQHCARGASHQRSMSLTNGVGVVYAGSQQTGRTELLDSGSVSQKNALRMAHQPRVCQIHPWNQVVSPPSCSHRRSRAQRRNTEKAIVRDGTHPSQREARTELPYGAASVFPIPREMDLELMSVGPMTQNAFVVTPARVPDAGYLRFHPPKGAVADLGAGHPDDPRLGEGRARAGRRGRGFHQRSFFGRTVTPVWELG